MSDREIGVDPGRTATLARMLFAASLIALGITGLVRKDFGVIWSGVHKDFPARTAVAYLSDILSIACGIGMLWRRTAAITSRVLLGYLALWMLLFRVPLLFRAPKSPAVWWVCGETAAMLAGAWALWILVAGAPGRARAGSLTGDRGLRVASVFCGLGLIAFGVAHFTFLERTVGMVPGWLPWHLAWAYFTGAAFVAAGLALIVGVFARLAATLSAWEMGLFTLLVWGPILVAHPDASQWDEILDSCVLTAAGWLVAECYRGAPWLRMRIPSPLRLAG